MPLRRTYRRKKYMGKGKVTLTKLNKQVKRLVARDKVQTVVSQWRDHQLYDTVTTPYQIHSLSTYSRWTLLWPSTSTTMHGIRDKARLKSIYLDNLITLDNSGLAKEYSTVNFTYIVFSPKDSRGSLLSETPTLTADVDYTIHSGKALLNMNAFKIHYAKRFTLTQLDITAGDATHCQRRFVVKLRPNKLIKAYDDNWRDMTVDPDPSNQLYIALFNDNSSLDGQYPRWELTSVATVEQ